MFKTTITVCTGILDKNFITKIKLLRKENKIRYYER